MVFGDRHGHGGNSEFAVSQRLRLVIGLPGLRLAISNHTILFDGDPALFNQYGVILFREKCRRSGMTKLVPFGTGLSQQRPDRDRRFPETW